MPSAVIRSTTCDGTSAGGIFGSGGCGACGACAAATVAITMQTIVTRRLVLLINEFLKPLPFISLRYVNVAFGIGRDVVSTIELTGPVSATTEFTDHISRLTAHHAYDLIR